MTDSRFRFQPSAILLVIADALIVYASFIGALKIRLGDWHAWPSDLGLVPALIITTITYLVALGLSRIYHHRPDTMHLEAFIKAGASMVLAWPISLTLTYLVVPTQIPARSVTAALCVFSIVGILGTRALLRFIKEYRGKPEPVPATLETISFDDILPRTPITIDEASIQDYLAGRTVLVTGAGGSIGSELCKRLLRLQPFRLILVDVSEYNLYQLENALRKQLFAGELEFRIGDVRDSDIMDTIFSAFRPDIVFHAAAYKHVPLLERHPVEAFRNNTLSTVSLVRLCEEYDAEQFVLISTDKAVEPSSVLGATKRLAEWYVRSVNADMKCKTVRFGNVLGSHGSVIPFFADQINAGGPVTVTHKDMRRFFMTADEACSLILQTLLLESAPVYTIDMGEPVLIEDLAKRLIGMLNESNRPIEIGYSGIRPGEKINESLWSDDETPVATTHAEILGLTSSAPFSRPELDTYFSHLASLYGHNKAATLRRALFDDKLTIVEA
ncbi:MAG: polysaccharide biosynthesis protein [Rhodothermales bacterium]|nr:polysaccharide biosynthesis protein [Rhodothermales bacterium]